MDIVKFEEIEGKILELRSQKVIIDSDVANYMQLRQKELMKLSRTIQINFRMVIYWNLIKMNGLL